MMTKTNSIGLGTVILAGASLLASCGRAPSGSAGNVTVQSAPLTGPNAAFLGHGFSGFALHLFENLIGEPPAQAAVPTFTSFKACNDTFVFIDGNGHQLNVNGTANPSVGQGLLTFSPTSTTDMAIGTLNLPSGSTLSEVDITFAVVPTVCSGVNYAVQFDPGTGPIDITQNTAFKFKYPSPVTLTGSTQTITLKLGTIVSAMVAQGAGLSNSSIQSINVGQAQ